MRQYAFSVPGPPVPKARARIGRGRAYTPARTVRHERLVWAYAAKAQVRPLAGDIEVRCRFYLVRRPDPQHPLDVDNLLKLVLDALKGKGWTDDSQVADLHGRRFVDTENPRTEVEIEEMP